ncbi:efflux RND transporter periplasmic adaptor subunit [Pseudomonas sp. P5_C3]
MLCACSPDQPSVQAPRPVRTVEINYDNARESSRYVGTVQSRHEVDQAFRVGGKVAQRKVDVGQFVREGDVLAVLDDSDYRLAEQASQQQWAVAVEQTRQADSDHQRLTALKADGSVSAADDERAHTNAQTAHATAEAEARKLELARNRLKYTVLRASRSGVVTAVRFEAGQVVAEGQPVVSVANPDESEIVIDVPEDQLSVFKDAQFKASLASAPNETFDVTLRELSPQAAAQTRTYRARLKPMQALPLGATATVMAKSVMTNVSVAAVPATALTQSGGQPAL